MAYTKPKGLRFDGESMSGQLTRAVRTTGVGPFSGIRVAKPAPRKLHLADPTKNAGKKLLRKK